MTTQPTNLPIPSENPRDLKFNSGCFDKVINSNENYYIDRFGVRRFTIAGFQYTAEEAIRKFGYITMDSFEDGATLTLPNQTLRYEANGEYYRWDGEFPKIVPAGSTPDSTGEVKLGAWVSVGDASLRSDLAKTNGAGLIGGLSKPITSWGAVGDGVTNNTSAFNSAEDSQFNDIYIPEGNFKVDNITFNKRYWGPGIVVIDHKSDFTGVGINDMTVSGIYNGQQDLNAIVRIKEASNPDKLEFSTDNGVTWHDTI
ncbi:TPA: hypothetical protein SIE67_004132, partial [Escherichia coli]|nr:hypothetical protein [Escherichia coli]